MANNNLPDRSAEFVPLTKMEAVLDTLRAGGKRTRRLEDENPPPGKRKHSKHVAIDARHAFERAAVNSRGSGRPPVMRLSGTVQRADTENESAPFRVNSIEARFAPGPQSKYAADYELPESPHWQAFRVQTKAGEEVFLRPPDDKSCKDLAVAIGVAPLQ